MDAQDGSHLSVGSDSRRNKESRQSLVLDAAAWLWPHLARTRTRSGSCYTTMGSCRSPWLRPLTPPRRPDVLAHRPRPWRTDDKGDAGSEALEGKKKKKMVQTLLHSDINDKLFFPFLFLFFFYIQRHYRQNHLRDLGCPPCYLARHGLIMWVFSPLHWVYCPFVQLV